MAAKRAAKAVEDAKEAKANELIRRKAGKVRPHNTCSLSFSQELGQDINQLREEIQAREARKEAEAMKRGIHDHRTCFAASYLTSDRH